jgi:hypothetical protein
MWNCNVFRSVSPAFDDTLVLKLRCQNRLVRYLQADNWERVHIQLQQSNEVRIENLRHDKNKCLFYADDVNLMAENTQLDATKMAD